MIIPVLLIILWLMVSRRRVMHVHMNLILQIVNRNIITRLEQCIMQILDH